jgi:putative FmdB family regulatory protein
MPWYDYRCRRCGSVFEIRRSMNERSDGASVECSECGSAETERVFRPIAVGVAGSSKPEAPQGASCGPHCACHPN